MINNFRSSLSKLFKILAVIRNYKKTFGKKQYSGNVVFFLTCRFWTQRISCHEVLVFFLQQIWADLQKFYWIDTLVAFDEYLFINVAWEIAISTFWNFVWEHGMPWTLEIYSNSEFKQAGEFFHVTDVALYTVNVFTVFKTWSCFFKVFIFFKI